MVTKIMSSLAELELQSSYRQPGKETFIVSFKSITSRNDVEKLKTIKSS